MPITFRRPAPPLTGLDSLLGEAERLQRFRPPFRFTHFFSPEDTLLCVIAAKAAVRRVHPPDGAELRLFELTAGSGLVGLAVLDTCPAATLLGVDIDPDSPPTATANARALGLERRAHFLRMSLWDLDVETTIARAAPHLLICNPPYVPEPAGVRLPPEAGSGADGTAHLRRAVEIARAARPPALAFVWSSLSDPAGIVRAAEGAGFALDELFVVATADGEYSGTVHDFLRTLTTAVLNESPSTVAAVAPDGAARFAYLLMGGAFSRRDDTAAAGAGAPEPGSAVVERIVRDFAARGVEALKAPHAKQAPLPVSYWILDRWDEVALRVLLHGAPRRSV